MQWIWRGSTHETAQQIKAPGDEAGVNLKCIDRMLMLYWSEKMIRNSMDLPSNTRLIHKMSNRLTLITVFCFRVDPPSLLWRHMKPTNCLAIILESKFKQRHWTGRVVNSLLTVTKQHCKLYTFAFPPTYYGIFHKRRLHWHHSGQRNTGLQLPLRLWRGGLMRRLLAGMYEEVWDRLSGYGSAWWLRGLDDVRVRLLVETFRHGLRVT